MTDIIPSRISLADAIAELRSEISQAQQEGKGKDVRFAATGIEVELSLDFELRAEGNAGISKWIPFVDLGITGGGSKTSLHKLTLTLEIDTTGDPSKGLISDSSGPAPVNVTS
jgi:hypothetical protein